MLTNLNSPQNCSIQLPHEDHKLKVIHKCLGLFEVQNQSLLGDSMFSKNNRITSKDFVSFVNGLHKHDFPFFL